MHELTDLLGEVERRAAERNPEVIRRVLSAGRTFREPCPLAGPLGDKCIYMAAVGLARQNEEIEKQYGKLWWTREWEVQLACLLRAKWMLWIDVVAGRYGRPCGECSECLVVAAVRPLDLYVEYVADYVNQARESVRHLARPTNVHDMILIEVLSHDQWDRDQEATSE
jgi:hypothetical protein